MKSEATCIMEFIINRFPLAKKNRISEQDSLLENGIVDSLGILELVQFLEREFGVAITDEELLPENFQTVQCVASFVKRKRDGRE